MTKEQFDNYNGKIFCKTCGHYVDKDTVEYKRVYQDGSIVRCKVCEFIKRRGNIPQYKGITDEKMIDILHYIWFNSNPTINYISEMLSISIDETIELYDSLHLNGKRISVEYNCEQCGRMHETSPSAYKKTTNHFCSHECYWNYKTEHNLSGEDSPYYNRIKTKCTNCGKDIEVIPYFYNMINSYGDNHNFCSQECYWKYRSKYYIGDKAVMSNYVFTEEQREKMKVICLNNSRKSDRFNSKIQIKTNEMLDEMGVNYTREYIIGYYAIDNYLDDYGLMIEVMGDYWHVSPLKYGEGKYKINKTQQKSLLKDKQKHSYIISHGYPQILYLWESDIDNNPLLCKELIKKYIESNGNIDNYHSFNWKFSDNLYLTNNVIVPFQDMTSAEYVKYYK